MYYQQNQLCCYSFFYKTHLYEILFLVILKVLEHIKNSRTKLSHGFLEIAYEDSLKNTYLKQVFKYSWKLRKIYAKE